MNEEQLIQLENEVRQEFQIPPYFERESLKNILREGEAYLLRLNPGRNVDQDKIYRALLKNYANYSYHHRLSEWEDNYRSMILTWQLGSEVE